MSEQLHQMYNIYNSNKEVEQYVEKYRTMHDKLLVDALQDKVVINYVAYLLESKNDQTWRDLLWQEQTKKQS